MPTTMEQLEVRLAALEELPAIKNMVAQRAADAAAHERQVRQAREQQAAAAVERDRVAKRLAAERGSGLWAKVEPVAGTCAIRDALDPRGHRRSYVWDRSGRTGDCFTLMHKDDVTAEVAEEIADMLDEGALREVDFTDAELRDAMRATNRL